VIKILPVATIRRVEAEADAAGLSYDAMMENAGRAVAARILQAIRERVPNGQPRVTVLVGPGNNGGDGLVAARIVAQESEALVRCYLLAPRDAGDPNLKAVRDAGLLVAVADDDQRFRVLTNMIASAHIVVDALFGIGARLPLTGTAEKVLKQVHAALNPPAGSQENAVTVLAPTAPSLRPERPYVIAVDCPSGLDCDTGAVDKLTIRADETVTFIAAKPGLFHFPGAAFTGQIVVADIGIPSSVAALKEPSPVVADQASIQALLPERPVDGHKGSFGRVLVVAGSVNYTGAPGLCAEGAYRMGAGLVTVATPAPVAPVVGAQMREATYVLLPHDLGVISSAAAAVIREELARYKALLIGPGVGREKTTGEMLDDLLSQAERDRRKAKRGIGFQPLPAAPEPDDEATPVPMPPLVIDADGLFLLSTIENWQQRLPPNTILTPHPGEMATLAGISVEEVQANRWRLAADKAKEWNCVLLLKGAHTVIAGADGRLTVLPFKTAALATAGTGDILAGMILALLGQGMNAYDAAVVAGYVHGLAGVLLEEAAGSRGVTAGDVLQYGLPEALALLAQ